jgi:hypothetical protein
VIDDCGLPAFLALLAAGVMIGVGLSLVLIGLKERRNA